MYTDDERKVGSNLLQLANPSSRCRWVERRTDEIEIIDERTMRRTVDLVMRFDDQPLPRLNGSILVPLARLTRGAHVVVDLGADSPNRLNRRTERALVGAGLVEKFAERNTAADGDFHGLVERAITVPPTPESFAPRRPKGEALELERLRLETRTAVVDEMYFSPERADDGAELEECLRDLQRWQRRYLLVVALDEERCWDTFSVRFSFLEALPRDSFIDRWARAPELAQRSGGNTSAERVGLVFHSLKRAVGGSYSWATRIPLTGAGESASFHAIVRGPAGFQVLDSGAFATSVNPTNGSKLEAWFRDDDLLPTTAHVYMDVGSTRLSSADFFASFYSFKTGLLSESVCFAMVSVLVHEAFYRHMSGLDHKITADGFDANFASTLVLLIPALLVAMASQRDAHRIGSKSFWALRVCLATIAAASLLGALTFALVADPATNRWVWEVVRWATIVAAARIAVGFVVHWWRSSRVRAVRRAQKRSANDRQCQDSLQRYGRKL